MMKRLSNTFRLQDRHSRGFAALLRFTIALLLTIAAQAVFGPVAAAQEFRIYTRVSQEVGGEGDAAAQQDQVLARTLTLFHAGKVYDYIQSVGEVTILEPAHNRFTILSTTRSMATQAKFEEILEKLNSAEKGLKTHVEQPEFKGGPTAGVAKALRLQLVPNFEETYNPESKSLALSNAYVRYEVKGSQAKSPEALASFLRYADWTCRLNYVLHPQTLYPASRLKLNESLRKHATIPVEVRLAIAGEMPMRFKAEHEIHWQLDAKDRSLIHDWETKLKRRETRRVSFREYQKAMLVSLSRRSR